VLLHEYRLEMPWVSETGKMFQELDVPFMVTEYGFVCNRPGHPSYGETATCESDRERGLSYRYATEKIASMPNCMGMSLFLTVDENCGGRDFGGGGENFNFGIVNVADQPYWDYWKEIRKTTPRCMEIHMGKLAPVTADELGLYREKEKTRELLTIPSEESGKKTQVSIPMKSSVKNDDCSATIRLAWTESYLLMEADVMDDFLKVEHRGKNIWENDAIELWVNNSHIGFSPVGGDGKAEVALWQNACDQIPPPVVPATYRTENGKWSISAKIPWKVLGFSGGPEKMFHLAILLDDADPKGGYRQAHFPRTFQREALETYQKVQLTK